MKNKILLITLIISSFSFSFSQGNGRDYAFNNYHKYLDEAKKVRNAEKDEAIEKYRQYYSKNPYSHHMSPVKQSARECLNLLRDDGRFVDYKNKEEEVEKNNYTQSLYTQHQEFTGDLIFDAYNRIWKIAEAHRAGELTGEEAFVEKYRKAILFYGNMEISRRNDASRYH